MLKLVAERGLVKGERIGVDGSTMEANAALRTIVRRDSGESYRAMLTRMAKESGIDTPSAEDLARFDRKRKGKTLSNADWKSPTDRDARIAKMKDGTTHLAYKPEHAVDLDTGVVVAAPIHLADEGDTTTLSPTLGAAARNLDAVGLAPSEEEPCVVVADKGYHSRVGLGILEPAVFRSPAFLSGQAFRQRALGDLESVFKLHAKAPLRYSDDILRIHTFKRVSRQGGDLLDFIERPDAFKLNP